MNWKTRLERFVPSREKLASNRWTRHLSPWLGHPKLWHWSRRGVALGVALGVFFGLLIPLAQIPVTAVAAVVLRANLPVAAASTLITNPVTFGPLYYVAYRIGSALTGDGLPESPAERTEPDADVGMWQRIKALGISLLLGLSIMATLSGLLTYALIHLVWRWRTASKRRRRQARTARSDLF